MIVGLYRPISVIAGRDGGMTLSVVADTFTARVRTIPSNPRSPDQQVCRACFREAHRLWRGMAAAEKEPWRRFAGNDRQTSRGLPGRVRGIDVFVQCSVLRQAAGLDALPDAPRGPRPQPPDVIEVLPAANENELVFRLTHSISNPRDYMVLVRVTPPTPTRARMPYECELRYACGWNGRSAAQLPDSGGVVRIGGIRTPIPKGARFGLEVRVMRRADGMASLPLSLPVERELEPPSRPLQQGVASIWANVPGRSAPHDEARRPIRLTMWKGARTELNRMEWRCRVPLLLPGEAACVTGKAPPGFRLQSHISRRRYREFLAERRTE